MKLRHWAVAVVIFVTLSALTAALILFVKDPVVLQPSGPIGEKQRDLFLMALSIMSLVAIPVFLLLFSIAWRYRASNKKSDYKPKWDNSKLFESIWWGIPIIIVCVLSYVAWQTSHSLDPFKAMDSDTKPLKVQVIALQWKWLFLYPEHNAASVNELIIPVSTPVEFSIAADAPMNSFWIPELGGQIYAMNGMSTKLHLLADKTGDFKGVSSNISGEGFADMKFNVRSVKTSDFKNIINTKSSTGRSLDVSQYQEIAEPSVVTEPFWYTLADLGLYQKVIDKYMLPHSAPSSYPETMNHEGMH